MNFTLRTSLIAITIISLWLGALISQNDIALECMAGLSALFVFLALPLAIWDSNRQRRPFWAGFFAVGFGNMLLIANNMDYSSVSSLVATAIGKPTVAKGTQWGQLVPTRLPAATVPATSALVPPAVNPARYTFAYPNTGTNSATYLAIYSSVPCLLTLMFAMFGGVITSRLARPAVAPVALKQPNGENDVED